MANSNGSSRRRGNMPRADLVIVANRLPVDRVAHADGSTTWRRSPGGLVTALEPVMRQNQGAWIGWHGAEDEDLAPFEDAGLSLIPVPLSSDEVEEYYEGFSNGTLWPLYHDVVAPPRWPRRARSSGCRTTNCSWSRRCCERTARTCGSASSSTSRSHRPSCS